jgi:hypothetical protein
MYSVLHTPQLKGNFNTILHHTSQLKGNFSTILHTPQLKKNFNAPQLETRRKLQYYPAEGNFNTILHTPQPEGNFNTPQPKGNLSTSDRNQQVHKWSLMSSSLIVI